MAGWRTWPTASTLAVMFSFVVYIGFWFAAPPFASISGVPAAAPLIRVFTLTILIDGITAVRTRTCCAHSISAGTC